MISSVLKAILGALLLSTLAMAHASAAGWFESYQVTISTTPSSPTLLFTSCPTVTSAMIANWNSDATAFARIRTDSTGFSNSATTGTARIAPMGSITLDPNYNNYYTGAAYAVSATTTPLTLDIVRVH